MRELVIKKITRDFNNGLNEIPFWGRTLNGVREPEEGPITKEQLNIILCGTDNEMLLEILDSQACDKYR